MMRIIAMLALLSFLGSTALVLAQEEQAEEADTEQTAETDAETFAPSEQVEADTAVAFPTDI